MYLVELVYLNVAILESTGTAPLPALLNRRQFWFVIDYIVNKFPQLVI